MVENKPQQGERSPDQYNADQVAQAARFMIMEPEDMQAHLEDRTIVRVGSGPDRDRVVPDYPVRGNQ